MDIQQYTQNIHLPTSNSHKGQNGKVLLIGGSELFHAASQWSLLVLSRMVDMVFYASIPSNNQIIQNAKEHFPNGIVIPREELENYIEESDVILIGPGMTRSDETETLTNTLLKKYPDKKWVIDAGALQMVDPSLLNAKMIVTPHAKEFEHLMQKAARHWFKKGEKRLSANTVTIYIEHGSSWTIEVEDFEEVRDDWLWNEERHQAWLSRFLQEIEQGNPEAIRAEGKVSGDFKDASAALSGATILRKGSMDEVGKTKMVKLPEKLGQYEFQLIKGGNVGMTKGGTGDVLAGLVAGLYAFADDPFSAAIVGSYVNKKAGDELYKTVGPFFNATDLANQIPQTLKEVIKS